MAFIPLRLEHNEFNAAIATFTEPILRKLIACSPRATAPGAPPYLSDACASFSRAGVHQ
jgi:hypothetical protein